METDYDKKQTALETKFKREQTMLKTEFDAKLTALKKEFAIKLSKKMGARLQHGEFCQSFLGSSFIGSI